MNICLTSLVISTHVCAQEWARSTEQSCIWINPLLFETPPFVKCNYPIHQYNEMLRAVCNSTESPEIKDLILRYSTLRGNKMRTAPLKPVERSLNEIAYKICLLFPQLIFHRRDLTTFSTQVYLPKSL